MKINYAREYFQMCDRRRGQYLSIVITLERVLDELISDYYFKAEDEKRKSFHKMILSTSAITLSSKFHIFKNIVSDSCDARFLPLKPYEDKIKEIIKLRNKFAHTDIDSTKYKGWFKKGVSVYKCLYNDEPLLQLDEPTFNQKMHFVWECNYGVSSFLFEIKNASLDTK